MKKTTTFFLVLFLAISLAAKLAAQNCNTFAGSPQSLVFNLCAGATLNVSTLGDEVLDFGDSLVFVVTPGTIGNPAAVNSSAGAPPATGVFTWAEWGFAFTPGVTYQIFAVAGQSNGSPPISLNLNDPCLSTSPVGTVTWHASSVVANAGADKTLDCGTGTVQLDGSGSSGFSAAMWVGPNGFANTQLSPTVSFPGTYCLTLTDGANGCSATDCMVVLPNVPVPNLFAPPFYCNASTSQIFSGGYPGNFLKQWTTTDGVLPFETNQANVVVGAPGTYCLTVTNPANGCSTTSCVLVEQKMALDISGQNFACAGTTITHGVVFNPQVTYPVSLFFQKNNEPAQEIVVTAGNQHAWVNTFTESATLRFWAHDATNCASDTTVQMMTVDRFDIEFSVSQHPCEAALIDFNLVGNVNNEPVSWLWSGGAISGTSTSVTQTGWYFLNVVDQFGCAGTDSLFVTLDYSGNCAFLAGTVRQDSLDNCLPEPGEPALAGWLVQATSPTDTFFATTDPAGHYFMPVVPGNYVVSVVPPNAFWMPCQNAQPASVPAVGDTATVDFLVKKLPGCPLLTVDLANVLLRRCFGGGIYNVHFCNEGTDTATDAYVEVQLDPFLTFVVGSAPSVSLGGNAYRFSIGDVEPGECGTFQFSVTVSCDAILGQSHCVEAHIFPDTSCLPQDPFWQGGSVVVEATCADSTRFTLRNVGTAALTQPLEYVVIEDAVMYRVGELALLEPGESMSVALPANGSTWHLASEQEPHHPQPSQPIASVEGCGTNAGGSVSLGFVGQLPTGDPEPWLDVDCTQNTAAFDPNDKQGFPTGTGNEHFIPKNQEIEYLVRFQNTGTDTAFNVVVRDTLSPFLDLASVRPGASSHAFEFEIYGQGILKFTFPNILLPDSNVNEPLSHGFVSFRVSQKTDLPPGTVIENLAGIYFDWNEPVLTNTTWHTIARPVVYEYLETAICSGETWHGTVVSADTVLSEIVHLADYDSVAWVEIEMLPAVSAAIEAQICDGGSYFFGGQTLTQAGIYEAIFPSENGCDSTVTLTLNVAEVLETELSAAICAGDTYFFDGENLGTAGVYQAVFEATGGCDSLVTLTLTVNPNTSDSIFATICEGENIAIGELILSQAGIYEITIANVFGCDSTLVIHLTVEPVFDTTLFVELVEGSTYNGIPIFSDTIIVETWTTTNGCDSFVSVEITVLTGLKNVPGSPVEVLVFPNPLDGSARVELAGWAGEKALTFKLLDVTGRVLRREEFSAPGYDFERRALAAGLYFFKIEAAGRLVAVGKMVLR